ncbi:MAG: hypothetical protein IKA49_04445 [Alistipes sp.]|nr:hypothetical protein [Alistipes sp.]
MSAPDHIFITVTANFIFAGKCTRIEDYIRRREWENRTDTLTYETIEWLESLK